MSHIYNIYHTRVIMQGIYMYLINSDMSHIYNIYHIHVIM